jgi:glycosyltransferase involved in cell wall biosynthesis
MSMQNNNSKPKILFLAQLPPPVHGASQRNLSVSESLIINKAFDLVILPLRFSKNIKQLGKASFRKFFLFTKFVFDLINLLFNNKFSFAYYTISVRPIGILRDSIIILILKIFKVKLLYHLRNKGVKNYSKNSFLRFVYYWVFKNNKVICLSKSISNDIIEFIDKEQLFIVNNGIKISNISVKASKKNETLNFIYLSHLRKSKGVMEFLQSFKVVSDLGYNISATVVGDEGDIGFNDIIIFCEINKISDKVKITGPLYGDEKFKALNEADIFVFPTYYYNEIFPGVILEAMQMGLPIITTSEGAIPDMIQNNHNGLIVERKDVTSIVNAMKKLIINSEIRNKISSQAKNDFYKYYTMDIFESNMLKTFKKMSSYNEL